MLSLDQIKKFYPAYLQNQPAHWKYMVKEYLLLMILDYLSTTAYIKKLTLIGGTNLRLVRGIDRFSEDIDFDCKNFSREEFIEMTDAILLFLRRNGLNVETRDKENKNVKAFRRNLYFPAFLFELGLSGYKEERFLIKAEVQDQIVEYEPQITTIKGCGFLFPFPVPPDDILCSMKLSALLSRKKGRDFYDVLFLIAQVLPNYNFLSGKHQIENDSELKAALRSMLATVNLQQKSRDFLHLLFDQKNADKVLKFGELVFSVI